MRTANHHEIKSNCQKSIEALMCKHRLGKPVKVIIDQTGWVNPCFFVNDSWVFRFNARDPHLPKYQREKLAFDLLRNTKVPVPREVILDTSKSISPYDVLITELIPGQNLETNWATLSQKQRENLATKAGEIFSELSSIELSKFGELSDQGPFKQTETWEEYVESKLLLHLDEASKLKIFDDKEINQFSMALNSCLNSMGDVKTPKLVHVDYNFGNLIYHNDTITGVVDFEWSFAGDPLYDLCRWFQHEEEWAGSKLYFLRGCGKETLTDAEKKRLAIYQMIRNVELCVVAKLHFDAAEAQEFTDITLKQVGTFY